jgi:hypothetical protein
MPFVPVANTALVEMRYTVDLQEEENTLYFEKATALVEDDLTNLGEAIITWWEDNYSPLVWTGVLFREAVVTDLTSASASQVTSIPPSPLAGSIALPPLPNNNSLTVSFRTALRGRSFRGRNYIVGIVQDQLAGANILSDATVTAWQDGYNALKAMAADLGLQWVVVSRFSGVDGDGKPIPRVAGVTTPVTTAIVVDNVVDSQRRRLPGRGR